MLCFAVETKSISLMPLPAPSLPHVLREHKSKIKNHFEKRESANIFFSFITGDKSGITPNTKKKFKAINLSFILTPSGIHLGLVMGIFSYLLSFIPYKNIRRISKITILIATFFIPQFYALKRLAVMRLLFIINFKFKWKIPLEYIFYITFLIALFLGHFNASPIGFIYSFLYIGTFFSLGDRSRIFLIAGIFSTQIILGLFLGEKVSFLSIPFGMFGAFLFTLIYPICLIAFVFFFFSACNWIEPVINLYLLYIKTSAQMLNGSFTSASIFLLIFIWCFFLVKNIKLRNILLLITLLCHTDTAMAPSIFNHGLP